MNKQEQIEEMVKTVVDREKNYVIGETECKKCNLNKCDLHCNIHSEISYDCETLYDAGYRNAEEVSKETAKEILSEIDNDLHDLAISYADKGHKDYYDICKYVHLKVISKITKKYGVEVEE